MQFFSLPVPSSRKGCLHEKEELERQLQGTCVISKLFSILLSTAYEKLQMEALKHYNQPQQHDQPQQQHDGMEKSENL